jgi:hypothetical protein
VVQNIEILVEELKGVTKFQEAKFGRLEAEAPILPRVQIVGQNLYKSFYAVATYLSLGAHILKTNQQTNHSLHPY